MTIQDLGSLGEFIAAIATIATLAYLAIQIRQNTRVLRGTFHDSTVNRIQAWQIAIASDPTLSTLMSRSERGEEITKEEHDRVVFLWHYALIGSESVYHQHARGNIDREVWEAQLRRLRGLVGQSRFRHWWRDERRFPLTESFESLINGELEKAERNN